MNVVADVPLNMLDAEQILTLEQIGELKFRNVHNQDNYMGLIFGGQLIGQSLAAAQRTVDNRPVHSCSGQFLRGGQLDQPLDFDVERVRDGRRFSARRVIASQAGHPVFDLLCSFHATEPGVSHNFERGSDTTPTDPDNLIELREFALSNRDRLSGNLVAIYSSEFPVEIRLDDPEDALFGGELKAERNFWFRMKSASAVACAHDQNCLLAFMSDYWFASVAGAMHRATQPGKLVKLASLNHSLWFHAPVSVDQWLLFRTDSPWAGSSRGLVRGSIYDRDGALIASAAQEILLTSL